MCSSLVVDRILDELKCRDSDVIEILMISAADALHRQRCGAKRCERLQPSFEDRAHRFISLQEDAADLPGPVVCDNSARGLRGCAVVEPEHAAEAFTAPNRAGAGLGLGDRGRDAPRQRVAKTKTAPPACVRAIHSVVSVDSMSACRSPT